MPTAITRIAPDLSDKRFSELRRDFSVERRSINEKERTVELSFASETPVDRWFGEEILECSADACDMARLNNGGALLCNHNPDDQIGVVETAGVDGNKCRAVVRFSKSARGQEMFQDVIDGIRRLVSVGYRVKNMVLSEQDDEDGDTYRVNSWEPYEISLVSIPADTSVGVGRSSTDTNKQSPRETPANSPKMEATSSAAAPTAAVVTPVETRERPTAPAIPESTRMSEIRAIGTNFNVPQDRVIRALAENESLDVFRKWVLEEHLKAKPVAVPPTIGMSHKDKRRYSITRAINRLANFQPLDGLEKECSDEAANVQRRAAPGMGFIVPHDIGADADPEMIRAMLRINPALAKSPIGQNLNRALSAGVFSAGGATVATELLGGSMIELLRNRMLLTQLGVGSMTGLVGNIAIPRQTGSGTAYWLAEGDSVTPSQQSLSQVGATPKKLAAQTAYTKQLLAQDSIDAEAFVRDDISKVLALARDLAGIAGTGGKQPLGILNGPTGGSENQLSTVTFSTTATWAKVLEFETDVYTNNADQLGNPAWLTNITVRNKWKQIAKIGSTYPVFLVDDNNRANGYDVNVTNQVGTSGTYANRVIFGVWGQAMYCDWAGQDVVVDPYTQAASGQVVVTVAQWTDFIVRHWPAFAISTDSGAQ